jgi:hypothetical protein
MRRVKIVAAVGGCAVTILAGFAAGRLYMSNDSVPGATGPGARTELTIGTVVSRWPTFHSDDASLASAAPSVQTPHTTRASEIGKPLSPSTCSNPAARCISRTWSHVNLAKKSLQAAKDENEKGSGAIVVAAGHPMYHSSDSPSFGKPGSSNPT